MVWTSPLQVKDVYKFKNQNTDIAVNIITYENQERIPLYITPHRNCKHTVQLLLMSNENTHHYTLVRNMSHLVAGRTKNLYKTHVCPYCFHCFKEKHSTITSRLFQAHSTVRDLCKRGRRRGSILQIHSKRICRPVRPLRRFSYTVCGQRVCQRARTVQILLFKSPQIRTKNSNCSFIPVRTSCQNFTNRKLSMLN